MQEETAPEKNCVIQISLEQKVLDFEAIVPPGEPAELEIGCGHGHFLVARAAKNPHIHYLGIERMMDRVRRVEKKTRAANLSNITVLRVEAGRCLSALLPDHRLQAIYLFFPDPWPKRRHHKNRLFGETFSGDLFRCLAPGGHIHIATDHEEYFHQMRGFLRADSRFTEAPTLERPDDERTCFEQRFIKQGLPTYACSFQR